MKIKSGDVLKQLNTIQHHFQPVIIFQIMLLFYLTLIQQAPSSSHGNLDIIHSQSRTKEARV